MSEQIINRDASVKVQISKDAMEAQLVIEPPVGEGKWPAKEQALEALAAANVVFGINETAVERVITAKWTEPVLVAEGQPAVHGENAEIKYIFMNGEEVGMDLSEDEFGRIDYRDLQTVQNVVIGEVLVEKIPPTPGEPGCSVLGKKIEPKPGKDKVLRLGKNVAWTSDNLKVVSTINGEPSLSGGKLSVFPIHEVKGDVNFKTGNISFLGSVVVRGNVDNGFKVEAEGDILIYGMVEGVELKSGGNIVINGGVSGMSKTDIVCSGDFNAKFMEHARVSAGGNVTIKEAIMYCQVNCDRKITVVSGKGLIVGGLLRCGEEISTKIIGSKFGTLTEVEIGVKPKAKMEFQELEEKLKENKANLDKAQKAVTLLERTPQLPPDRQAMYQNLLKTTFVLKGEITQGEARRKELTDEMVVVSKERARVRVKEVIFPGVKVTISNAVIVVKDEYRFVTLVYHEGDIQIQTYR